MLAHFSAPQHLFPCPWAGVSEGEVELRPCTEPTASALDQWVSMLLSFVSMPISEQKSEYLQQSGKVHFAKDTVFQSTYTNKTKIIWVRGAMSFVGYASSDFFPLHREFWMKTEADTEIEIRSTEELIASNQWKGAIANFHQIINQYITHLQKNKEIEEIHRIQEKKRQDAQHWNQAYYEMAAILNPTEVLSTATTEPLFVACQKIGLAQGLQFVYPTHPNPNEDVLSAICSASNLRFRQVRLKGEWWKEDGGHLLGFQQGQPKALVNDGFGVYRVDGERITQENASEFSPFAFMFYVALPDHLTTGKELIKFFLLRNKREFVSLLVYGSIAALLSLIPPFVTSNLYNTVIPKANLELLYHLVFLMLTAALSATIFTFFRSLILVRIKGMVSNELQMSFWDRLFKLPVFFFRKFSSGSLYFKLFALDDITQLISNSGQRAILSGVFSVFYFIAMIVYSAHLTVWAFFVTVLVLLFSFIAAKFKIRFDRQITDLRSKINGILIQTITGIAKLRISNAEASIFAYWARHFTQKKKLEMEAQHVQNAVIVANAMLPYLSTAMLFALSIALEAQGRLSIFAFLAFDAAFVPFSIALFDLSNVILEMTSIFPLWNSAKVILEEPLEVTTKKIQPGPLKGAISVDHVQFSYTPQIPVLRDVSIQIAPGEFVGVVGSSGCGKSTLLRLLLGFEHPLSGEVSYDGQNLDTLNVLEIRKQIGVVLQESNLFSGSIFENIVCGGIFTKEDVERAVRLSGFEKDLDTFPMGLHTVITSGGSTISGGQRQRLLIARALIGRPKILFFDEATSALDNTTQERVSHAIDELEVSRFVIAHRLSTLNNADRIYVLDQGMVVQQGTFRELSREQGLFKNMLERQSL